MKHWTTIIPSETVRFLDDTQKNIKPYQSFAIDDTLIETIDHSQPVIRLWRHHPYVILGIADTKLPYLTDGVAFLNKHGYNVVVRNSGGLAVVADDGVLSLSLILPEAKTTSINEGYEKMVAFVRELLKPWTDNIDAFEVVGSYCPGDYDLSIGGKKFAGISQRRVKNGLSVQIYLALTADNQQRAKLIQQFYKLAKQGEDTRFTYPEVDPDTMESLTTLVGQTLDTNQLVTRIKTVLSEHFSIKEEPLTEEEQMIFAKREQQMIDRNKKALGPLF
ncbi:octanoyl-[GcvH]:protein N-octanoyltransferase [Halolactibacillus miurensis]|uniref:Octanoyl-[GcvH]:protein N-octanoyltransferase n=1 Tax=Halolactibacillus miurensis TaxID=306541 RepID=A0A1I6Q395_9BACI|nr:MULTISPECIES: biotin/lipoate A/B protein ligase family protein [Halolactibacillus]GEM03325.1 octanoyl-[GcvH]:protein N-octanoyltransferase [Halolactibacillus miurensis]SFS46795.1 octanoyl-[GcvH]:protein N-octanoyltransferase/lipoyl amidotransferase [Halolactibacillus miurensis]